MEQYTHFPNSLANGKRFLSRRSMVEESVDCLAAIGVPETVALDMSNFSRMSAIYWSCLIQRMR